MIQAEQFDVKTGKPIQVVIDGQWQPAVKQIEHSYLEHWCQTNSIDTESRFSVAQFYESVHDADRRQLEAEGKYLVFSSGSEGYFTDYETAQLMTLGSQTVEPIYAGDRNAAHYAVAYGGLIASDGVASTTLSEARILVIDDENRTSGSTPLIDGDGQKISAYQLNLLYDKMGDGTMLVPERTMQALQTGEEREQISFRTAERAEVDGDISTLVVDMVQADSAAAAAERQEIALARRSVYQFRAASPELPGIAKGTMSSSQWCDRLGVDAIVSLNDIKGDDKRLSRLGVQDVSNFWINRKATAKYGQQTVGPQVKYSIPDATRLEINPRVQEKAEQLAQVAGNYDALSQRYLEHKEHERARPYQSAEEELSDSSRPDWLYNALASDKYGQLTDQASVVRGLAYYIQGEWQRLSANGTSVPSAMAQHHSQLKPWEVCNKDLPHGAIVAYYRSPFPNVGAAAIAINNTEVIKQRDREAFSKQGVAYLPPDTAKHVAITDFDGDINGFFVGYEATVTDLPEQLREKLAGVNDLSLEQQYEAGRAAFEEIIQRLEQGQDNLIEPSVYPVAVKEFIERTAPAVKPPQIIKQQKEKHSWQERESHSEATWRAWGVTADNPTGKVANAGMSLQSLALELKYAPEAERGALLNQVSNHCSNLLAKAKAGKVVIPDDDWLVSQGFSPFYEEKIEYLASASSEVASYGNVQRQKEAAEIYLQDAHSFLRDVANGPNAVNLQTAVDTAKSAKGIDTGLHKFVEALQYKKDDFRRNKNNPSIYVDGKVMPTSLDEPVSWGVQQVNEQYSDAQLQERKHEAFQAIFPKAATGQYESQAKAIIQTSSGLTKQSVVTKSRHSQRRSEDQKPTIEVTLSDGRQLSLQNIDDSSGQLPIWRAEGSQPSWTIRIKQDTQASEQKRFPAQLIFINSQGVRQAERIGYVSPESTAQYQLSQKFQQLKQMPGQKLGQKATQKLTITAPIVTTQVPWAQQNDSKLLYEQRTQYIERSLAPPEGKDPQVHAKEMAIALWRQSKGGRKLVMQTYPGVLRDRLSQVPEITVGRLQISSEQAQQLVAHQSHTVQFARDVFLTREGDAVLPSVSVLTAEGNRVLIGAVSARSIALPEGATYRAVFSQNPTSEKVVDMRVMELPMIEQSKMEVEAFQDGRCHLTFDEEPYSAYGVREGDIIIARAADGGPQIALQVKEQYAINERITEQDVERWAAVEKSDPDLLAEKLAAARSQEKPLWGLNVQPLGSYLRGQVVPFKEMTQPHQVEQKTIQSKTLRSFVQQLAQSQSSARQLAKEDTKLANSTDERQRIKWAESIASTVRLAYRELSARSGTDYVETNYYSIALNDAGNELVLRSKADRTELARFCSQHDKALSATGLGQVDFDRFSEGQRRLEAALEQAGRQEKDVDAER